jgi:Pyridoxamine 5'-phosphate oxidase
VPDREPVTTKNLDRYGAAVLPWSTAHDLLALGPKGPLVGFFLTTVRPDGRPHTAGVGAVWHEGDLYFTSGAATRKARDLLANPACSIGVKLPEADLTLEGRATVETTAGTLDAVATLYRELGWPAQVEGAALTAPFSAPSAGPSPWQLYRFTYDTRGGAPHGGDPWCDTLAVSVGEPPPSPRECA